MADTTYIKSTIEPFVREWLVTQFPGNSFVEQKVQLPNGEHKFDAVSVDGLTIGNILCNRPKTRTGNENNGAVRKALNDIQLLQLLPQDTFRFLVFTDNEFRDLMTRRSQRIGAESIKMLTCPLPSELNLQLLRTLDAASLEQGP